MRTGYAIFDVVPEGGQLLLAPAGDTSAWHWLAQEGKEGSNGKEASDNE